MVRFLDKMGKRNEAIAAMEANKDKDDELRLVYVDMLTEWKMYDEALKVADIDNLTRAGLYGYSGKILAILDLINDRDKTFEVCKAQFKKTDRKQVYFDRLQKEMTKEEWDAFIDDSIRDADEVFVHDYDHVEAQIYMKRKMYDHLVKFCMHTLYRAEENLEKYAKYMSEADQRLVAQDIDYDHFAGWIRRLYNSSPECEKIAREVAEEIVKENPNKAFRRMFERIGVIV